MLADKLHGTDPEDVIINAFKLLDPDNKGLLPKAELDVVLKSQADRFTDAELEQLYSIAPVDAEGMVDYKGKTVLETEKLPCFSWNWEIFIVLNANPNTLYPGIL